MSPEMSQPLMIQRLVLLPSSRNAQRSTLIGTKLGVFSHCRVSPAEQERGTENNCPSVCSQCPAVTALLSCYRVEKTRLYISSLPNILDTPLHKTRRCFTSSHLHKPTVESRAYRAKCFLPVPPLTDPCGTLHLHQTFPLPSVARRVPATCPKAPRWEQVGTSAPCVHSGVIDGALATARVRASDCQEKKGTQSERPQPHIPPARRARGRASPRARRRSAQCPRPALARITQNWKQVEALPAAE